MPKSAKHEHPGGGVLVADRSSGIDPVQLGHGDVHHHDVGIQSRDLPEQGPTVPRLRDHLDRTAALEDAPQPGPNGWMVVRKDDPHASAPATTFGHRAVGGGR